MTEPERPGQDALKAEAPASDRASGRASRDLPARVALLAIMLFAFGLGLAATLEFRVSPYFLHPIIDEEAYLQRAQAILAGCPLGDRTFYQDPLYPYLLALGLGVSGHSLLFVRLVQAGFGSCSALLVFLAARRFLSERFAALAALVLALYGPLYFFGLLVEKASTVILLSAASCALGAWAVDAGRRVWPWPALGFCLGALTLLRGNVMLITPLIMVWAFVAMRREGAGFGLSRAGLIGVGFILAIAPFTVRNLIVSGEFTLTTSQGGANFYIGANDFADGRYVAPPFVYGAPSFEEDHFRQEAERRSGRPLRPAEVSRFWFGEGLRWIKDHPGKAARLWAHKARLLVHDFELPDIQGFDLTRQHFAPALRVAFLSMGFLWGPALVGMAAVRRARAARYPAIFAWLYAASIVPFFIVDRYRVPLLPPLAIFAAAGVAWTIEKARRREFKPLAAAAVFMAGTLLVSFLPTAQSHASWPTLDFNLGNRYLFIQKPEDALRWHARAATLDPNNELYLAAFGEAASKLGHDDHALLSAEAARPDASAGLRYVVAERLWTLGELAAAAQAFELALEKAPDLIPAQLRLIDFELGASGKADPDQAARRLEAVLQLRPDFADAEDGVKLMAKLAEAFQQKDDWTRARKWAAEALARKPADPAARAVMEAAEAHEKN